MALQQTDDAPELHDLSPEETELRDNVLAGLRANPRFFPSAYLYDERGAKLFEEICETPEYYVTRTEAAILRSAMPEIAARIGPRALIVEPGSGSGVKTRIVLENLEDPAGYVPLDISKEQLEAYAAKVNEDFPNLVVRPVCADFYEPVKIPLEDLNVHREVIFIPGSTIGNMEPEVAVDLLRRMHDLCGKGGGVLIGVDLKKDVGILEAAYNDAGGVSAAFGMNMLHRLQNELDADIDIDQFRYYAEYQPTPGRIEMGVESLAEQTVRVNGERFAFRPGDRVRTEWSYKYSLEDFAALAKRADLEVEQVWTDPDALFSVQFLGAE